MKTTRSIFLMLSLLAFFASCTHSEVQEQERNPAQAGGFRGGRPGGGGNNRRLVDLVISAENAHQPGGAPCPPAYDKIGSVADCGNGNCYGNQSICARHIPPNHIDMLMSSVGTAPNGRHTFQVPDVNGPPIEMSKVAVIDSITITPENSHIPGGRPCENGYVKIGSFADCGAGNCYGNQNVCVKWQPFNGVNGIRQFMMTPENAHVPGMNCPAGQRIGTVADCGNAICKGNQAFCVQ